MKNMLRKDFLMEIKKNKGRFVAIFFIVALGAAFYSGIRAAEPSLRVSGDAYFDRQELMDVKVMGTMGLTDEDIAAITELDEIEFAEGSYSKDVLCQAGDLEKVVHILAEQDRFNQVDLVEGKMPQKKGECLVEEDFYREMGYKIGDEIELRSGDGDPVTDSLVTDRLKIVGVGNSPLYISMGRGTSLIGNGEISGYFIVPEETFHMDVYTEAYIRIKDAKKEIAFTKEYEDLSERAVKALESIEKERCKARREEILNEANGELEEATKTITENEQELTDASIEIGNAKSQAVAELAKAKKKLEDGERQLAESKRQIADGERQIQEAEKLLLAEQKKLEDGEVEYQKGVQKLKEQEQLLKEAEEEYQKNYDTYMPMIQEGKAQIESGKKQLEDGKVQLQNTKAQLTAVEQEFSKRLTEGEEKYQLYLQIPEEDRTTEQRLFVFSWPLQQRVFSTLKEQTDRGLEDLQLQEEELLQKEQELLEQEKLLLEQEQQLSDAKAQIEDGKTQLENGKHLLATSKEQIESGKEQLALAWKELGAKKQELMEGKKALDAGESELQSGKAQYETESKSALQQIADGEKEIADGKRKLEDAKREIADAKAEIAKIENPKWYIQDRDAALSDYSGYGENADRMRALGKVFPALFFLVAALISLTTMTRMVEEQRVQIGTLKALGYSKPKIAEKYVLYAITATLGGSVIGVLIGEKIFPFIIVYAYKILYEHIPDILVPYHLGFGVQATAIAVLCILAATIGACYKVLAAQPAELMRPPAPKIGKKILLERIGFVWKHLNFSWKSSIRNLVRYKKRFFMTIFGIGGCMALMLVGFGLKDCIYEVVDLQFERVQFYDASIYMDEKIPAEEKEEILEYFANRNDVQGVIQNRMQKVDLKSETGKNSVYLSVPEKESKIDEFLSFHSRTKNETYSLQEEPVILTEKMAKMLGVGVGDQIVIEDSEKGDKEVTIDAICENYMGHYLYLSEDKYEELYGCKPAYNSMMYKMKSNATDQIEAIGTDMLAFDSVLSVSYASSIADSLGDMLKSLNLVIVVLIISAGMLAFVVLYNLNNINITERKRELATLKVLGFYDGEVASYVYRENVILTLIGAVFGMGMGFFLHRFTILTVEVNEVMFGRQIHWQSYLYSFLFTVGFSMFVNFIMYYVLKKIDMVESLKSVE